MEFAVGWLSASTVLQSACWTEGLRWIKSHIDSLQAVVRIRAVHQHTATFLYIYIIISHVFIFLQILMFSSKQTKNEEERRNKVPPPRLPTQTHGRPGHILLLASLAGWAWEVTYSPLRSLFFSMKCQWQFYTYVIGLFWELNGIACVMPLAQ